MIDSLSRRRRHRHRRRARRRARTSCDGRGESAPPAAIVLLSDGKATTGRDPLPVARQARRLDIPINTVALGTEGR